MARPRKKSYHHGNLRRALIDAAIELIRERGTPEFTLRELARRLDVTHAATYHHFKDKDALLRAVALDGHMAMLASLEGAASDSSDPLSSVGDAYVRFAVEHPAHFRVMFSHRPQVEDEAPTERVRRTLETIIERARANGTPVDIDATSLATTVWAGYHGLASLLVQGCVEASDATLDDLLTTTHRSIQTQVQLAAAS